MINASQASDAGEYKCVVSNGAGAAEATAHLVVHTAPVITTLPVAKGETQPIKQHFNVTLKNVLHVICFLTDGTKKMSDRILLKVLRKPCPLETATHMYIISNSI